MRLFPRMNADSPAERNTEKVNITKNLVRGKTRTPKTARPHITSRPTVPLGQVSNVTSEGVKLNALRVNMYTCIYTIYK